MVSSIRYVSVLCALGVLFAVQPADADQCQALSADQANKAAELLPEKAQYLWYCPPCGDKAAGPWQTITELVVAGSGASKREVRINGKPLDLAYVYFLATDGKAHNVALAVGCQAVGVAAVLELKQPEPPPPVLKRYKLTLTVEIMSAKANGKRWDPAGDAPDPIVRGSLYEPNGKGARTLTCRQKNSLTATCLTGTVIEANETTVLNVKLEDEDGLSNDDIGWGQGPLASAIAAPGTATTLKTTGQIKSATLTLTVVP